MSIRLGGGDPAPWDRLPRDGLVARCSYVGPADAIALQHPKRCPDGQLVVEPPASLTEYFFDRAGHHSVVTSRPPVGLDPCSGEPPASGG